jgi:hypothetical protein
MIAELIAYMNHHEQTDLDTTYRRVLFPEPAIGIHQCKFALVVGKHTLSVDPQEGPRRFPTR